MRKKKRIPVSIMLLVFLFLLTGCTLGGTKQEAETKVDYYIGVVDDNAPYYYEEDGLPKGYYADFVAAMAKEEPFTYKFVPVDASSYNENLSKKSIDGFIGATNASSGKNILASKSFYTSNICVLAPKSSNISTLKQIKDNSIAAPADTEEEVFQIRNFLSSTKKHLKVGRFLKQAIVFKMNIGFLCKKMESCRRFILKE